MQVNKRLLIFILMAGVFGILNTEMGFIGILPYIAQRYDVTIVHAGLLISLFALGVALSGPVMPLIFSRFNRKYVMLLVLGLFTICNTISVLRIISICFWPCGSFLLFSIRSTAPWLLRWQPKWPV